MLVLSYFLIRMELARVCLLCQSSSRCVHTIGQLHTNKRVTRVKWNRDWLVPTLCQALGVTELSRPAKLWRNLQTTSVPLVQLWRVGRGWRELPWFRGRCRELGSRSAGFSFQTVVSLKDFSQRPVGRMSRQREWQEQEQR